MCSLYIMLFFLYIFYHTCDVKLSPPLPFCLRTQLVYVSALITVFITCCVDWKRSWLHTLPFRYGYEACKDTADWLLNHAPVRPLVGIVCGSGLGSLAVMLKDPKVFNYNDIPNFPKSTGEMSHDINISRHPMCTCANYLILLMCLKSH